jgi:hypothetical protein
LHDPEGRVYGPGQPSAAMSANQSVDVHKGQDEGKDNDGEAQPSEREDNNNNDDDDNTMGGVRIGQRLCFGLVVVALVD